MMSVLIRREIWERRAEYLWIPLVLAVIALLPSIFVASQWDVWLGDFDGMVVIELGDNDDAAEQIMGSQLDVGPHLTMNEMAEAQMQADAWEFHQRWITSGKNIGLDPEVLEQFFSEEEGIEENWSLNVIGHGVFSVFLVLWLVVSGLYLLDALYRDRRDRSVLFWQSMPVPEWQVVMAKLLSAWVLTGLVFWLASLIPQWLLVWSVSQLPSDGLKLVMDYSLLDAIKTQLGLLLKVWLLCLPLPAWLLLVSSRANKIPQLWAFLIPAALAVIEFWWFGSTLVWEFIKHAVPNIDVVEETHQLQLTTGGVGAVVFGTLFSAMALAGAVYFRRQQQ